MQIKADDMQEVLDQKDAELRKCIEDAKNEVRVKFQKTIDLNNTEIVQLRDLASNVSETQMMLAKLKRYEDTMDAMQIKADNMQEVHDEKDAELRKCGAELMRLLNL